MLPPDTTTAGIWIISLAAVITALLILARFAGLLWRFVRRVGHFLDDWFGEEARDGQPARPGFPARIGELERRTAAIEHELHPNSGASLRDAVDRVERAVDRPPPPTVQQTFVTPPSDPGEQ